MKDLMIDLETLGTTPESPIVAIGAVLFDKSTGETGSEFEAVINFSSACSGRKIDPSTVAWWLGQSDEARKRILRGNFKMRDALTQLADFINMHTNGDVYPWGNGATFDISMLENCYQQYGLIIPWKFWAVRDCRTVEHLSELDKRTFERDGVHHSALDDAKHQVKYISAMVRSLGEQ